MTPARRLDPQLLSRIAAKTGKSEKYTREQISKRAARLGVAAEAAQIAWARELGIGTAVALRRLPPHIQDQARTALAPSLPTAASQPGASSPSGGTRAKPTDPVLIAADFLITDPELKSRCRPLLRRKKHLDTAIREATVVLDDRLRKLSGITEKINPAPLVSKVLNPEPSKAILVVSEEPSEQQGVHNMCLGLVLAYRDPAHHTLNDKITPQEALKLIAFVDVLLSTIGSAKKRP